MKKYKLINKQTKEEHLCDKVTMDGFDYYVSDFVSEHHPKEGWFFKFGVVFNLKENLKYSDWREAWFACTIANLMSQYKKVIATNNPNIDIPKVVDEIEELADEYFKTTSFGSTNKYASYKKFKDGYKKSQETHPFSEEDMIEFAEWCRDKAVREFAYSVGETNNWELKGEQKIKTTKELLELWKEKQPKIIYYNE